MRGSAQLWVLLVVTAAIACASTRPPAPVVPVAHQIAPSLPDLPPPAPPPAPVAAAAPPPPEGLVPASLVAPPPDPPPAQTAPPVAPPSVEPPPLVVTDETTVPPAPVAEPAPPAGAEPPPPQAYAGPEPCRRAVEGTSPVARACRQDGLRGARAVMKQLVNDGWNAGVRLGCQDCHLDSNDRTKLAPEASELFAKLLAATAPK